MSEEFENNDEMTEEKFGNKPKRKVSSKKLLYVGILAIIAVLFRRFSP